MSTNTKNPAQVDLYESNSGALAIVIDERDAFWLHDGIEVGSTTFRQDAGAILSGDWYPFDGDGGQREIDDAEWARLGLDHIATLTKDGLTLRGSAGAAGAQYLEAES
jgi:hypothetical protein